MPEPKLKPQARAVLDLMRSRGSITDLEAYLELRIRRLSARILEIRQAYGDERVRTENEPHEGGHHARYYWVEPSQSDLFDLDSEAA